MESGGKEASMNSNNNRNRHKNKKLSWLVILILHYASSSLADKTNVNEVTDLFDQAISNKDGVVSHIEGAKAGNISDIESGASLGHIQDIDKTNAEISKLSAIRAVDLDDAGRAARQSEDYKFYDQGEFETNFNKPGYAMHKKDVQEIVGATSALLGNITASLKDLGGDCSEVKGSVQKTPIHVIETKREEQRNTEYDQVICQQPKNQYRCSDSLSLRCVKRRENTDEQYVVISRNEIPSQFIRTQMVGAALRAGIYSDTLTIDSSNSHVFKDIVSRKISNNKISILPQSVCFCFGTIYSRIVNGIQVTSGHHPINGTIKIYYQFTNAGKCETWSEDWNQRCVLE